MRITEPDPRIEITLQQVAFAKAWDSKMTMSPAEQNARDDEAEAKMKAKAAADRAAYEQALLAAERRRVTGER